MDYTFPENFDDIVSRYEAEVRHANVVADDAFVLAMARAVKHGKEKAVPGITVDTTPLLNLKRFAPAPLRSSCGSPGAMCVDTGADGDGARTMK